MAFRDDDVRDNALRSRGELDRAPDPFPHFVVPFWTLRPAGAGAGAEFADFGDDADKQGELESLETLHVPPAFALAEPVFFVVAEGDVEVAHVEDGDVEGVVAEGVQFVSEGV